MSEFELAPIHVGASNQVLGRTSPYSNVFTKNVGNTYPWLGASSTGMGVPMPDDYNFLGVRPINSPRFGRKAALRMNNFGGSWNPMRWRMPRFSNPFRRSKGWCLVELRDGSEAALNHDSKREFHNDQVDYPLYEFDAVEIIGRHSLGDRKVVFEGNINEIYSCNHGSPQEVLDYIARTARFGYRKKKRKRKGHKATGWCVKKGRVVRIYKFKGLVGRRYYNRNKVPKGKRCYKTKAAATKASKKGKRRTTRKRKYKRKRRSYSPKRRYYYYYRKKPSSTNHKGEKQRRGRVTASALQSHIASKRGGKYSRPKHTTSGGCRGKNVMRCQRDKRCTWKSGEGCKMKRNSFGMSVNPANRVNYQYEQYATNAGTPTIDQMRNVAHVPTYGYPMQSGMSNLTTYNVKNNLSGMGF